MTEPLRTDAPQLILSPWTNANAHKPRQRALDPNDVLAIGLNRPRNSLGSVTLIPLTNRPIRMWAILSGLAACYKASKVTRNENGTMDIHPVLL